MLVMEVVAPLAVDYAAFVVCLQRLTLIIFSLISSSRSFYFLLLLLAIVTGILVPGNKRPPRSHGGRATVKQLVSEDDAGGLW